jgi:DNA-binding beta-propeller fold protein YncE
MKHRKIILTLWFGSIVSTTLIFSGCSDDEQNLSSSYWILNRLGNVGNISLYDEATQNLTESIFTINSPASLTITSANRNSDHIYLTTTNTTDVLRKIDMGARVETHNVVTWLVTDQYAGERFIEFHNGNVIVMATVSNFTRGMSTLIIKTYNENLVQQDSLAFDNYLGLMAAKAVGKNLYLALRNSANDKMIVVFDLTTKSITKTIPTTAVCTSLVPLNDNKLLAINPVSQLILNATSGEVEKTVKFPLMTHATVGQSDNVIYYLHATAQPSLTPYILAKADLTTGESVVLGDGRELIQPPIVYNKRSDVIVSGGGLKIFKTDGTVKANTQAPGNTTHIFIK